MKPHSKRCTHVMIVDPRNAEYEPLMRAAHDKNYVFHLFADSTSALRAAGLSASALWLLNAGLVDISALDLLDMLRERGHSRVCVVADEYDHEQEIRFRQAGASLYTSKPVDACWLDSFRGSATRWSYQSDVPRIGARIVDLPGSGTVGFG